MSPEVPKGVVSPNRHSHMLMRRQGDGFRNFELKARGRAGDSTLVYAAFSAAFLARVFFTAARVAFASSARLSAQRFFVAAMIRFMPSSLIRRFAGSDPAGDITWDCPLIAAHLFFWASAIRRRDAAEILRFRFGASGAACRWSSILRSSAILESMCCFCASNPAIAAVMIS